MLKSVMKESLTFVNHSEAPILKISNEDVPCGCKARCKRQIDKATIS